MQRIETAGDFKRQNAGCAAPPFCLSSPQSFRRLAHEWFVFQGKSDKTMSYLAAGYSRDPLEGFRPNDWTKEARNEEPGTSSYKGNRQYKATYLPILAPTGLYSTPSATVGGRIK
ncbi:MAG: hypothetical protein P4M15_12090 [Alphaproteobacteria bacterium]|nr:hypothetical protein [Alphaproteobacteria bacterium]